MKGKISEIFESIQGEGIYFGEKQIFVRFFGCKTGCKFCDTKFNSFKEYEPQELFQAIKRFRGKYHSISFTGGEPLEQKDFLEDILTLTCAEGYKNYLDTNGILYEALAGVIDSLHILSIDLKLPSSTGLKDYWQEHAKFLKVAYPKEYFLKAVICESTKEEDIRKAIGLIRESKKNPILVLQPDSYEDQKPLEEKAGYFRDICRKENICACVIPQIHKIIGVK